MAQAGGCSIGIDPGERWVGVARAGAGSSLALPLGTIDRRQAEGREAAALAALLEGEAGAELVVGVPLRADGREDAQAAAFREFGERLAAALGAVCVAQDERFSSDVLQMDVLERQGNKARSRGKRSVQRQRRERARSHAQAAARILQRYLDARDGARARRRVDRSVP